MPASFDPSNDRRGLIWVRENAPELDAVDDVVVLAALADAWAERASKSPGEARLLGGPWVVALDALRQGQQPAVEA